MLVSLTSQFWNTLAEDLNELNARFEAFGIVEDGYRVTYVNKNDD